MSSSLVTMSSATNLILTLGLKKKEGMFFSVDGECIFIKGKTSIISYKEEEQPSSSGRSTKLVKIPTEVIITPEVNLSLNLVGRANIRRIFLSPNPKLFEMGVLAYPQIIEPLQEDKVFCYITCNASVSSVKQFEELDHFMRMYVLS